MPLSDGSRPEQADKKEGAEIGLLKLAKERGAQIIPGIEMFVHQAARQFEIWTGKPAPWDEMLRVVLLALQERAARLNPAN